MDVFYYYMNKGTAGSVAIGQHGKNAELYARFWLLAVDTSYNAKMFFQLLISEGKIAASCSFDDEFMPVLYQSFLMWVDLCRHTQEGFSMAQYMEGAAILYRHFEQFVLSHPEDWHHVYPFIYL